MKKLIIKFSIKKKILDLQTQYSNISHKILENSDKNLLFLKNHPLSILKYKIQQFFQSDLCRKIPKSVVPYKIYDKIDPIVSISQNFDQLLFQKQHISRKKSDTYYINENLLLRTHTSAHQLKLLKQKKESYLIFGDVYRKDQIDASHFPIFHQMEAIHCFQQMDQEFTIQHLKNTLQALIKYLFGNIEIKWESSFFPFTDPSFQINIKFDDKWLQMLGCGVIQKAIMKNAGRQKQIGWAAGLGLERFAMILFNIPDIRYFWSTDSRFLQQFKQGKISSFEPFSKVNLRLQVSLLLQRHYFLVA